MTQTAAWTNVVYRTLSICRSTPTTLSTVRPVSSRNYDRIQIIRTFFFVFLTVTADIEMLANRTQTAGFLDALKSIWTPELNRPFSFIMLFFFFWSFATFIPAKPYLISVFEEIGLPCTAQWTLVYIIYCGFEKIYKTYYIIFRYLFSLQ